MIATEKQSWNKRRFLTRQEALSIHAFHSASFWLAASFAIFLSGFAFSLGQGPLFSLVLLPVTLAFSASVAGTATDFMSMRIPDRITGLVLLSALAWWGFEAASVVPSEGLGNGRQTLGLLLPGQGEGSIVPDLSGAFYSSWLTLDVLAGVIVFIPLYLSFTLGLGFGGGDVKLMTALVFFLGWPLGFDFVILTYFFGGIASVFIILTRQLARLVRLGGVKSELVEHLSGIKTFAYAPAISLAAVLCIAQKAEGFFQ